jgi:hypothetical protein
MDEWAFILIVAPLHRIGGLSHRGDTLAQAILTVNVAMTSSGERSEVGQSLQVGLKGPRFCSRSFNVMNATCPRTAGSTRDDRTDRVEPASR